MAELNTRVILAKGIKMDREFKNVLNYTETQLINLLTSQTHIVAQTNKASFINPTGVIYVPFTYSQCLQSNYIAFQNPNYSNKWFFAFVEEVIFHSKNMQEIRYTIDSWSTWFSYWTAKPCFVIREHVNDDTIGLHTVDEGLNVGDVICTYETKAFDNQVFYVAVMTTHDPTYTENGSRIGKDFSSVSLYNSNFFGNMIFLFKIDTTSSATIEASIEPIIQFLYDTMSDKSGDLSCISSMFIVPDELIPSDNINLIQYGIYLVRTLKYTVGSDYKSIFLPLADTTPAGLYVPKNNKCYSYPYNYLFVTNNSGNDNIYKYEDFDTVEEQGIPQIMFSVYGAISIGYSAKLVPNNYRKIIENTSEAIPLGKYPTCGWTGDAFVNWLTQNAINIPLKLLGIENSIMNYSHTKEEKEVLDKEPLNKRMLQSLGFNIAGNILSTIGDFKKADLLPNISHGGNTGDVDFANNDLNFTFRQMRCKDEYMKQIDSFFTMCGYKINEIKLPNITGRTNFNFIQIAENEDIGYGNVPSIDMDIINKACRRGVTIWHNHATLGDYTVSNNII